MKTKFLILLLFSTIFFTYSQNLHNDSNAVSLENEANSVTGWSAVDATIISDNTDSQSGIYSMRVTSDDAVNDFASYDFNVTSGTVYTISIWARRGAQGTGQIFKKWEGFSDFATQVIASNVWTEYTFTVTANITGTAQIRCYVTNRGDLGDELFVDSVSITAASSDTEAPSAITDLIATNTTLTTTDLSWSESTDNVGVTDYEVFQDGVSIGLTGGATTFNATGLSANTSYDFTVFARDAAGNISAVSNTANVTTLTDTEAPSAITDLLASNTTSSGTDLSWSASTDNVGVTDYEVFQDGVSLGLTGGLTNFSVTGLSASTSYDFTVFARDAAGNVSTVSNTVSVTTLDPPDTEAPSAITDLIASNTTMTSTDLSWSASTDNVGVTDYEVFQDGVSIGLTGGLTNFNVTGLSANTSYDYTVFARDAVGNISTVSNTANITTLTDTEAPSAITDLLASNTTSSGTDLSWSASTDNVGVTDYEVFQDGVSVGLTGGLTNFSVTGLSANTSYDFTVFARDGSGNVSAVSNTAGITTLDVTNYTSGNANLPTVDWTGRDLFADRNLGIGTTNTQGYRLAVAGNVVAEEIRVALQVDWPDFVFNNEYELPTLNEVERFINKYGHLINIPSAQEVQKHGGIHLGEMNAKLLQKIEELTLYTIDQQKQLDKLKSENESLKQELLVKIHLLEQKLKDKND